mgnify:CR=1 FL=1
MGHAAAASALGSIDGWCRHFTNPEGYGVPALHPYYTPMVAGTDGMSRATPFLVEVAENGFSSYYGSKY